MGARVAVSLAALALSAALAGCLGGDDADSQAPGGVAQPEQRFTVDQVRERFRQVFGEPLDVLSGGSSFTQLRFRSEIPSADAARFGDFTIIVVGEDYDQANFTSTSSGGDRRPFPKLRDGVLLDDTSSSPKAVKAVGNVVLQYSAASREGLLDARFQRLAQFVDSIDEPKRVIELPPGDVPCARARVDFTFGDTGTCRDRGAATTVVAGTKALNLPGARATGLRWGSVRSFADDRFAPGQRIRAQGRFVGVRLRVENTGDEPLSTFAPTLAIGRARFTEAGSATSYLRSSDGFPVQPGNRGTYVAAFDVGARYARDVSRTGRLLFGVDERGALRYADGGAPRVLGIRLSPERRVGGLPRGER